MELESTLVSRRRLGDAPLLCRQAVSDDDSGSAGVLLQGLSAADAHLVTLTVNGGGLSSPRTETLAGGSNRLEVLIDGLPAAAGYSFTASAADRDGNVLYAGSANAAIVARSTAYVLITLLQVTAPDSYANAAPVIDSAAISSARGHQALP